MPATTQSAGEPPGMAKTRERAFDQLEFAAEGEAVRGARLVAVGRDDPDVVAELARDLLHHGDAGRIDAVVIGDEDAQAHSVAAMTLSPPI